MLLRGLGKVPIMTILEIGFMQSELMEVWRKTPFLDLEQRHPHYYVMTVTSKINSYNGIPKI